jgi:dUTP pyrophosphatase
MYDGQYGFQKMEIKEVIALNTTITPSDPAKPPFSYTTPIPYAPYSSMIPHTPMNCIRVDINQPWFKPTKSYGDAGYDLYSAHEVLIEPHGKAIIKTNLAIAIPAGYYGRIAPRSSIAWKLHTDIGAGVIDSVYRGEIGVVMFNHSNDSIQFKVGDKIAQIVFEKYYDFELIETTTLDSTVRGTGGFGSTGSVHTDPVAQPPTS